MRLSLMNLRLIEINTSSRTEVIVDQSIMELLKWLFLSLLMLTHRHAIIAYPQTWCLKTNIVISSLNRQGRGGNIIRVGVYLGESPWQCTLSLFLNDGRVSASLPQIIHCDGEKHQERFSLNLEAFPLICQPQNYNGLWLRQ